MSESVRAMDEKFPKQRRLRKSDEFRRTFDSGYYAADDILVCNAVANHDGRLRLGLSISRKVGNAVVRNRWKRAIRESFRRQREILPGGMDLVFRPKFGAAFDSRKIEKSLPYLVGKVAQRMSRRPVKKKLRSPKPARGSDGQG